MTGTDAWLHLTNWGNSVLMMPTALAIAVGLWLGRRRPLAWRWAFAFAAAVFATLATKVAFLGWGVGIHRLDFTGISGHSMLAASVLTMLAWWNARGRPAAQRATIVAAGAGLAALIAASRLVLHTHSPSEVAAGLAVGYGVVAVATSASRAMQATRRIAALVTLCLAGGFFVPLGPVADEPHGLVVAIALALSGRTEVYTRDTY